MDTIILANVLFIPSFCFNLLSVSSLHVNTPFPLIFLLILVLFKTSHRGGRLGWVTVLVISTF